MRFIRHHAKDYGVDGNRLGVIGGSSGGHLSLMLGTGGGTGPLNVTDEVDRESSAVQCVACFYPPTDLLNLGKSTEDPDDGGPPKSFRKGFGPKAESMDTWKILGRDLSPIYHITRDMPPTFIVHAFDDKSVTVRNSLIFFQALLDNERVLLDSELDYFRSVADFQQAISDLERAIGAELPPSAVIAIAEVK